jgi:hypothetical protein
VKKSCESNSSGSLSMGLYSKTWRFCTKTQLQQGLSIDLHFAFPSKFPLPPSILGGPLFPPPNCGSRSTPPSSLSLLASHHPPLPSARPPPISRSGCGNPMARRPLPVGSLPPPPCHSSDDDGPAWSSLPPPSSSRAPAPWPCACARRAPWWGRRGGQPSSSDAAGGSGGSPSRALYRKRP